MTSDREESSKVETCRGWVLSAHEVSLERRRYHSIRRGLETSDVQLRVRPPGRPFKGSGLFVCRISSVFGRYRRTGSMAFNETMMETRERKRKRRKAVPFHLNASGFFACRAGTWNLARLAGEDWWNRGRFRLERRLRGG